MTVANLVPNIFYVAGEVLPSDADIDVQESVFLDTNVENNRKLSFQKATIKGIGEVEAYEATLVGKFIVKGDVHWVTSTGHTINMSLMFRQLRENVASLR